MKAIEQNVEDQWSYGTQLEFIEELRAQRLPWRAIAEQLNGKGQRNVLGGVFNTECVRKRYVRHLRDQAEAVASSLKIIKHNARLVQRLAIDDERWILLDLVHDGEQEFLRQVCELSLS